MRREEKGERVGGWRVWLGCETKRRSLEQGELLHDGVSGKKI